MSKIDFGSSTGKNREYHQSIGDSVGIGNSLSDEGKNIWQKSYARVLSIKDMVHEISIKREDIKVNAKLGFTPNFWVGAGAPDVGDMVKIEHKKDYFNARIVEVVDPDMITDDFGKSDPRDRVTLTDTVLYNKEYKRVGSLFEAVVTLEGFHTKPVGQ